MASLAAHRTPPWADILVVTTLASFLSLAALLSTQVGRTALVDQWERTAVAFGRPIDDAGYARLQSLSGYGTAYAAVTAIVTGPVLTMGVALALALVVGGAGHQATSVRHTLAVASHAGTILALRQVVTTPLNYVTESLASPTSLSVLVTGMGEASPLLRFLGVLDIFVLWWAVVLALGAAALTGRRVRPLAFTFTGVYVALALLLALAMAATGGTV
jgi:hypothetical protein